MKINKKLQTKRKEENNPHSKKIFKYTYPEQILFEIPGVDKFQKKYVKFFL